MNALSFSLVVTGVLRNAELPELNYSPEHHALYLRAPAARRSVA